MADLGVFNPSIAKRILLVDGKVTVTDVEGSRHSAVVDIVAEAVRRAFGQGYYVRSAHPLAVAPTEFFGDPEPDIAVVPGRAQDYFDAQPKTALLVIEVAETSLADDRGWKASMYAKAKIPDYWIVNLVEDELEVHRRPLRAPAARFGWAYRDVTRKPFGRIAPLARPDRELDLGKII
jgi:Uma2 family endonuclease